MIGRTLRLSCFLIPMFILMVFIELSCAPGDVSSVSNDPSDDESIAPRPAELPPPAPGKAGIDSVLEHIRKRPLLKDLSFWTIFHGILGMGPDDAMVFDPETKQRIKAIDYIANGGEVRGLEFRPTPDGVEVETMPGSIIGQGHLDQFVAEVAEWDIPKNKKFIVEGKECTFEDFIRQAKAHASVTTSR